MSTTTIAIAVVLHAGRVLIGRRAEGVPLAGYWEFPGGKVLPDETPLAAAVRECREETGLEVQVGALLEEVEHAYPHGQLRLFFYQAEPANASQTPAAPFRWVAIGELSQYDFPPANATILEQLREMA